MLNPHRWKKKSCLDLSFFAGLLCIYMIISYLSVYYHKLAIDNGSWIIQIESDIGIHIENVIHQMFIRYDNLVYYATKIYFIVQLPTMIVFLTFMRYYMRVMMGGMTLWNWFYVRYFWCNFIHVIVYYLFPCAPPRLYPEYGYTSVDPLTEEMTTTGLGNKYAAMPSMHVTWSLMIAITIYKILSIKYGEYSYIGYRKYLHSLIFLYPMFVAAITIVTAHHFILDVVGAVVLVIISWIISYYLHSNVDRSLQMTINRQYPVKVY
jgi:membrane-associated phospholipid phosphatase